MESFFNTLKNERMRYARYQTRDAARQDILDYIEGFYNRRRRTSPTEICQSGRLLCRLAKLAETGSIKATLGIRKSGANSFK
jgi:hypothetical protein